MAGSICCSTGTRGEMESGSLVPSSSYVSSVSGLLRRRKQDSASNHQLAPVLQYCTEVKSNHPSRPPSNLDRLVNLLRTPFLYAFPVPNSPVPGIQTSECGYHRTQLQQTKTSKPPKKRPSKCPNSIPAETPVFNQIPKVTAAASSPPQENKKGHAVSA